MTTPNQRQVAEILRRQGAIRRGDHPELRGTIARLAAGGSLTAVLPGTYVYSAQAHELVTRLAAVAVWSPDAVVIRRAGARLAFWPELDVPEIELAGVPRPHSGGFRSSRRRLPPELTVSTGRLRLSSPAATAVDLCDELGGDPIDRLLRSRQAGLTELWAALERQPGRRANRRRRRLLIESRAEPWSQAERRAHRLLFDAGIRGWRANHPVVVAGHRFYLDIAFPGARLAVEIDGAVHERDAALFQSDRQRQNLLHLDGWLVLRFTWQDLTVRPEVFLTQIRRALAQRARARTAAAR